MRRNGTDSQHHLDAKDGVLRLPNVGVCFGTRGVIHSAGLASLVRVSRFRARACG